MTGKVAPFPAKTEGLDAVEKEPETKQPFLLRILGLPPLPPELQVPDDVFELLRCERSLISSATKACAPGSSSLFRYILFAILFSLITFANNPGACSFGVT
jgi:hypothetical protein